MRSVNNGSNSVRYYFKSDEIILTDNIDDTKQTKFDLADIQNGAITTLKMPNNSGVIALVPPDIRFAAVIGPIGDALGSDNDFNLTATIYNEGNGLSLPNGLFTAPVSGLYQFSIHYAGTSTGGVQNMVINYTIGPPFDTTIIHYMAPSPAEYAPTGTGFSTLGPIFLEQDSTVLVQHQGTGGYSGGMYMGALIRQIKGK